MITCRDLTAPEEFEAAVHLQVLVWQMDARGAVPTHLMQAVTHGGGSAIGAFDGESLVGFALAFLARRDETCFPWSHMAAVHPEYQSRGIGFMLKQAQRTWAMQQGYRGIGWTFDPLQRRNAAFNLRHLGAIAQIYHANFYGEMTDGINAGLPSDRLEITWRLDDARVAACAAGHKLPAIAGEPGQFLLWADEQGRLIEPETLALTDDHYRVEIPYDRAALHQSNRDKLVAWQMALQRVLQTAFAQGYAAVDFEAQDGRCWYVIQRRR